MPVPKSVCESNRPCWNLNLAHQFPFPCWLAVTLPNSFIPSVYIKRRKLYNKNVHEQIEIFNRGLIIASRNIKVKLINLLKVTHFKYVERKKLMVIVHTAMKAYQHPCYKIETMNRIEHWKEIWNLKDSAHVLWLIIPLRNLNTEIMKWTLLLKGNKI